MGQPTAFSSRYFGTEHVQDGIWAAIATDEALALGNAAIVDLGDATLLVDSFVTPVAARDLRAAAEELTGRPPRYLLNTHHHPDHVYGNQVFKPEASVIATFRTRQRVVDHASRIGPSLEQSRANLAALRQRAAKGEAGAEVEARAAAARLEALEELRIVPPDVCFERKLSLHGSRRRAEVLTFGGGHTSSDAFVWVPDARVLIAGDLVSVGARHVWAGDGNPSEWTRILEEMSVLGPERLIPGHGGVGSAADLASFTRYMGALTAVIEKAVAAEASPDDIEVLTPPEPHRENVMWFRRSAHVLVSRALGRPTQ